LVPQNGRQISFFYHCRKIDRALPLYVFTGARGALSRRRPGADLPPNGIKLEDELENG
jgi:hypothetical protein